MAKDGTNRGGPRPGLGRPKKALTEKIQEGTAKNAKVLPTDLPEPDDLLRGADIPPVENT